MPGFPANAGKPDAIMGLPNKLDKWRDCEDKGGQQALISRMKFKGR
jgi:hypothetical protein